MQRQGRICAGCKCAADRRAKRPLRRFGPAGRSSCGAVAASKSPRRSARGALSRPVGEKTERKKNGTRGGLVTGKRDGNHLVVGSDEPRDAATISDVDAGENAVHKGDAHCGRPAVGLEERKRGTMYVVGTARKTLFVHVVVALFQAIRNERLDGRDRRMGRNTLFNLKYQQFITQ